ncbi:hypothetical protein HanPI659440_Chr11g0441731 [Helianthus annuus]|nr:hypothetical protein HanPI659440_Chr11g0441731 [Helianthus annuus]
MVVWDTCPFCEPLNHPHSLPHAACGADGARWCFFYIFSRVCRCSQWSFMFSWVDYRRCLLYFWELLWVRLLLKIESLVALVGSLLFRSQTPLVYSQTILGRSVCFFFPVNH